MNILSIDLGNKLGICTYKNKRFGYEYVELKGTASETMTKFCAIIANLINKHKPDIVISSTPVIGRHGVSPFGSQMKKYGALCFACAEFNVSLMDYKDSHAKKVVLSDGSSKKADIKEFYMSKKGIPDIEDVRDARMFLDCYLIETKTTV